MLKSSACIHRVLDQNLVEYQELSYPPSYRNLGSEEHPWGQSLPKTCPIVLIIKFSCFSSFMVLWFSHFLSVILDSNPGTFLVPNEVPMHALILGNLRCEKGAEHSNESHGRSW